jgi:HAMP domain-containing protein
MAALRSALVHEPGRRDADAMSEIDINEVRGQHYDKEQYPPELGWGDTCIKCGEPWPCTTIRMADEIERLRAEVGDLMRSGKKGRAR